MKQPFITIVIANWNGKALLEPCLESIYAQSNNNSQSHLRPTASRLQRFEVVIVDNGSTDGSVAFIEKTYPKIHLIKNSKNLGFARANNQGINASKGDFILTLNNDTKLAPKFFSSLIAAVEGSAPEVGMWAAKILSMEDKNIIDSVGGLLIYPDGLARGRGRLEHDNGQFDEIKKILLPSACAALYRKAMLDETGLFDEGFFAYCEDTDLGLRSRLLGWEAVSVPKAIVYHDYSASSGRYSTFKGYHVERNRAYVVLKNFPLPSLLASAFYTLKRYVVQLTAIRSGKGASARISEKTSAPGLVFILIRAYFAVIIKSPSLFSKRRRIQKTRVINNLQFGKLLSENSITVKELILKD